MVIDDLARKDLLFDFYGQLLTPRQQQIAQMYIRENLTLSEISQELDISRQAVHDALKIAGNSLDGYEEKLGLVKRYLHSMDAIAKIDEKIGDLMEKANDPALVKSMEEIKRIIDSLEE